MLLGSTDIRHPIEDDVSSRTFHYLLIDENAVERLIMRPKTTNQAWFGAHFR